jgi:DNA-binding NarL/FixJ family response regulator
VQDKKIISYVCFDRNLCDVKPIVTKLEKDLPIIGYQINEINDLFPLLADPKFHTDYITIYVENFYKLDAVDHFELLQTLDTLLKCTVYRTDEHSKPKKRDTKIVAVIAEGTPLEIIKDILEFDVISYVTPAFSTSPNAIFKYEDCKEGIKNMIEGGDRVPESIKKFLKSKTINAKKKNGIVLTPRQKQIFELVSKRGASNKIIAKTLNITESTVKLHMGAILKKYNVKNRTQLAVFSQKNNSLTEV